jgi:uncharacterized membrane protein YkvA (DUF1232 family)
LFTRIKEWARGLKKNLNVLYKAYMHKSTPWYAKVLIVVVIAYAVSPIDLIPDFIPVLGYLDDLLLIPAGIALSFRLIPPDIIKECRESQEGNIDMKARGKYGAVAIILIWALAIYLVARALV